MKHFPAAAAERSAILKHEVQKRSLQCSDDLLSDIASKCDGYDAYDLEIPVDRSMHAAIGRSLSAGSTENEKPTLVRDDFLQAMQNFIPVAMHDITKPVKSLKKIHNQQFAELTGNNIFKGDVRYGSGEKPLSEARRT